MKLAQRTELCTCPTDIECYVAIGCPQHFGAGLGFCVPHMTDTETLVAAVAVRDNVGFCASCLDAHEKAAARNRRTKEGGEPPDVVKLKHRDNDGSTFWVSGLNEDDARETIAGLIRTAQRHRCLCRQVPIRGFPKPASMAATFQVEVGADGNVARIVEKLPEGR